jgi:hypothetical protein
VYLGLLGLSGLYVVPHFVLHLLIVNFSWIVSASGCRHILPNHLNLGVFVAVLFLYSALFYFIVDLGIPHLSQHSVVLVYIVGKVKPSWFQKSDKTALDSLNITHLDKYYWTLAVLSSINLVVSILVAIWYRYEHSAIDREENRMSEIQLSTH